MRVKKFIKKLLSRDEESLYRKFSFAQSGEDLIVEFIFKYVLDKYPFTYFDIGAHHPFYLSNTALFYKNGLKGVSVEPDPLLADHIRNSRPGEECLNIGVGYDIQEDEQPSLEFFIMSARSLNTFSRHEAERINESGQYVIEGIKNISVMHIHKLFRDYFLPDFLSIDVEGIDFEILKTIDFDIYRPVVLCIETAEFSPVPPGKKLQHAINYLKEKDYLVYADTFNNTIFVDNKYIRRKDKV